MSSIIFYNLVLKLKDFMPNKLSLLNIKYLVLLYKRDQVHPESQHYKLSITLRTSCDFCLVWFRLIVLDKHLDSDTLVILYIN